MPGRRVERLNEQFRRELTEILHSEAKDPRVGQVTVTGVRTAPDLSFARVFIAPGADEAAESQRLDGLRAALPFLRRELGARMRIRRVPELRFEIDRALTYGQRIEQLLHEVAAAEPPASADAGERGGEETGEPGDAGRDD